MSKKIIIISVVVLTILSLYVFNQDVSIVTPEPNQTTKQSLPLQQPPAPINQSALLKNQSATPQQQPNEVHDFSNDNLSPIERIKAIQEQTQLHKSVLKDHEQFNRYPEGNAAITDAEHDPIMQRYAVDERTTMSEDKSKGLTIWADKKFYLKEETVTVFAYVQDNEGNKLNAEFKAQLLDSQQHTIRNLVFEATSHAMYQTQIELANIQGGAGIYKILINSPEHNLTDGVTFTLTQPDIELTGEFKEHINSDGELVFEVQTLVSSRNQYYLQASLYSSTQVAIGASQSSSQLDPGLHWLPLSFSGLMIKDAGESGPYVLKNVSLAKVTIPMMRTPLLQPNFTTDSYGLDEFD